MSSLYPVIQQPTEAECAACTGTDEHPWCERTQSEWCGRSNPELIKDADGVATDQPENKT